MGPSPPDRQDTATIVARAARGLGRIDKFGQRGVVLVTHEETEAMAVLLGMFGLPPIRPEETPTADRFTDFMTRLIETHTEEEAHMPRNPNDRQQQIPEERMISCALQEVENLGAHPTLTDVVVLLSDAQRKLAEWHDAGRPGGDGAPNASIEQAGADMAAYRSGKAR